MKCDFVPNGKVRKYMAIKNMVKKDGNGFGAARALLGRRRSSGFKSVNTGRGCIRNAGKVSCDNKPFHHLCRIFVAFPGFHAYVMYGSRVLVFTNLEKTTFFSTFEIRKSVQQLKSRYVRLNQHLEGG